MKREKIKMKVRKCEKKKCRGNLKFELKEEKSGKVKK